jgi:uncharacterized protein (DUF1810 family)
MRESDAFDLARFVDAQEHAYEHALAEVESGTKRTHWMWFVFPQLAGLGRSGAAQRYAIRNLAEARAYLAHPLLGARLRECTQAVNRLQGRSVRQVFGSPDDLKFCSSMTLFELAAGPGAEFTAALEKYFSGRRDTATLQLLAAAEESPAVD